MREAPPRTSRTAIGTICCTHQVSRRAGIAQRSRGTFLERTIDVIGEIRFAGFCGCQHSAGHEPKFDTLRQRQFSNKLPRHLIGRELHVFYSLYTSVGCSVLSASCRHAHRSSANGACRESPGSCASGYPRSAHCDLSAVLGSFPRPYSCRSCTSGAGRLQSAVCTQDQSREWLHHVLQSQREAQLRLYRPWTPSAL